MKGFVYFIKPVGLDGPYKIGFSTIPMERFDVLLHWSPFLLEIEAIAPGTHHDEMKMHNALDGQRLHKEWFNPSAKILDGIRKIKSGVGIEDAFDLHHIPVKRERKNKRNHPHNYPDGAFL